MTKPGEWYECPEPPMSPPEYRVVEMPVCKCGHYAEELCPACGNQLCGGCLKKCEACHVPHCLWCLFLVDDLLVCWRDFLPAMGEDSVIAAMEEVCLVEA